MDKRADLALAVFIVGLSAFYYYEATKIPFKTQLVEPLGPGGLSELLAVLLGLGALCLIIYRLRKWKSEPGWLVEPDGESDQPDYPVSLLRVMMVAVLMLIYILFLPQLGFVISTPVFMAAALALWGVRNWKQLVGLPLGTTLVVYLLFASLLKVRFPEALLLEALFRG